jgi:hypothetical protein
MRVRLTGQADVMDLRLEELVVSGSGVVTTAGAVAAAVTPGQLRWAVRSGRLVRIERGAYVSTDVWNGADARSRHLLRVRAAQLQSPGAVAVAESAAVVWGLPLPDPLPDTPRLLLARDGTRAGGRGVRGDVVGRRAWLTPHEIRLSPDGIRVTTPDRTVIDCARHLDRPWSLAVADAARRYCRVGRRQLQEAADRNPCAPGHPVAVWVAGLAEPKAESPLESLARAVVVLGGHPPPRLQIWLTTSRGMVRVDLLDVGGRVVIEADGRMKYTDPGALWREKLREDALRATGREVVRFTFRDYRSPGPWLRRYRQALARAEVRPPLGRGPGA